MVQSSDKCIHLANNYTGERAFEAEKIVFSLARLSFALGHRPS